MNATAAERMRRLRARRRKGAIVTHPVPVSAPAIETLINGGLLDAWDADDREAVTEAVETLLERLQTFSSP